MTPPQDGLREAMARELAFRRGGDTLPSDRSDADALAALVAKRLRAAMSAITPHDREGLVYALLAELEGAP